MRALVKLLPKVILCVLISTLLANCYVLEQSTYISEYSRRAVSIDELIQAEKLASKRREFFLLVKEIKNYATERIGLRDDDNYSIYVEIDKSYLLDVVSATKVDAFLSYQWDLPYFGRVPYKGYFEKKNALRERDSLEQRGYDVFVRKADAFSTLGFYTDPVFSFMEDYSIFRIAALIIHEQTHATVYFENRVQFNEGLATFVGYHGALRFVQEKLGTDSPEYAEALLFLRDLEVFRGIVLKMYGELKAIYDSDINRWKKLKLKADTFDRWKKTYAETYYETFVTDGFIGFVDLPLNNALLQTYCLYLADMKIINKLSEKYGGDLKRTVAEIVNLKKLTGDPRHHVVAMLK